MIDIKERCCGCSACANICPKHCIYMEVDSEGFLYPAVEKSLCIECGMCERVCPVQNSIPDEEKGTRAYAAYAKSDELRRHSTSGGIFSLLAGSVVEQGGVVFGCALSEDFRAEHTAVEDASKLWKLQGSKYVQSDMKDGFAQVKQFLDSGRLVLFSGTPCQIEGLRSFLQKDYDGLYLVDLVCHGVPSPLIWEQYKVSQEKSFHSKIRNIYFRDKEYGWKNYRIKLQFQDGGEYSSRNWQDTYLRAYLKGLISRPSCYDCSFRNWHRQADLTLGDFWGIEQILPEWKDDKGVSLVLIHSDRGYRMLEQIADRVECREVSREEAVRFNPSIIASQEIPAEREKFFAALQKKGYKRACQKYVQGGIKGKMKGIINKLRKIVECKQK